MTPVSTPSARGAGAAMIALGVLMAMAGRASLASPEVLRSMVEPSFKPLAYAAVSWLIRLAFWAALWMTASKLSGARASSSGMRGSKARLCSCSLPLR